LTLSQVAISVDVFTFYIPELAKNFFGDSLAQWGIFFIFNTVVRFFSIFHFWRFFNFRLRKWTLGPKLSEKCQAIFFLLVKKRSFLPLWLYSMVCIHLLNKRFGPTFFECHLTTVGKFVIKYKKISY
jgi:hypothetical protein